MDLLSATSWIQFCRKEGSVFSRNQRRMFGEGKGMWRGLDMPGYRSPVVRRAREPAWVCVLVGVLHKPRCTDWDFDRMRRRIVDWIREREARQTEAGDLRIGASGMGSDR